MSHHRCCPNSMKRPSGKSRGSAKWWTSSRSSLARGRCRHVESRDCFLRRRDAPTLFSRMERSESRQREGESGAFPRSAFDVNISVHQFEIFLDDVQAESDAVKIPGMSFPYLLEGAEDSIHVTGLDADAGVGYGKFNAVQVPNVSDAEVDAATGRKFKRIADQVLHDFLELGHVR